MNSIQTKHSFFKVNGLLLGLAAIKLVLHLASNHNYGYFRDEFYYLACGEHLDWGYVDHPPLSIFLLALSRMIFGDSIFAVRLLPAIAGAVLVLMTGLLVRVMGGGKYAQALAALCVIIAPAYLITNGFYSMNAFEPLFWVSSVYVLTLIIKQDRQNLWLLFGIIAGLGIMNKHSHLFFLGALIVGILLTPHRRYFLTKGPWMAMGIAFLIVLPNLIWQIRHDWATLEFMRNAQAEKNYEASPWEFLKGQILQVLPFTLPLWITGLLYLFIAKEARDFRYLAWAYVALFAFFVFQKAKFYYLAPFYPLLFAPGAIALERGLTRPVWSLLKPVVVGLLAIGGAIFAPLGLPLLDPESFPAYAKRLGVSEPKSEKHEEAVLPQYFADMCGWQEMVDEVARAYNYISAEDREKCALFTQNYGQAGAIDLLGREYGLPKAISGHNNYWLWGPRDYTGEVVMVIGGNQEDLEANFESVETIGLIMRSYSMPYENNLPIYLCRNLKTPIKEFWARVKEFI